MHEATWTRAEALAMLDAPERRSKQDPDAFWRRVGVKRGDIVVDVGAGSGFFTFPAADKVGPDGRVYAVDVSKELVELIRERAEAGRVRNVRPVLSSPTHIPLEDALADVALLANVLHGIPPETVDEAIRLLRPGGLFVDVDWKKRSTPDGPPREHRLSIADATKALGSRGLSRVDAFDVGPYHYALVFVRARPSRLPGRLVSAE